MAANLRQAALATGRDFHVGMSVMRALADRRGVLGLAVAAAMTAIAPAALGCGYDNPQSVSRGALNWVYPDSLHVIGAISKEVTERRLPLANFNQGGTDLFGRRYRATTTALEKFGELLRTESSEPSQAAFSLVLVEPVLWTRFEPGVLVGAEIVRMERGETGLTITWPWVVAFGFGLLHGFGFAGALADLGLPRGDIPLALFSFNVGVELGQLIFIAAILAVVAARRFFTIPRQVAIASAYGVGTVAMFWVFERAAAF